MNSTGRSLGHDWPLVLDGHDAGPPEGLPFGLPEGPSRGGIVLRPPYPVVRSGGVDLVDLARVELALRRCGKAFERRVADEQEHEAAMRASDRVAAFASLFSVKESVVKVAGGLPKGASYQDISVGTLATGFAAPVQLRGVLAEWAEQRGVRVLAGAAPVTRSAVLSWALAVDVTSDGEAVR